MKPVSTKHAGWIFASALILLCQDPAVAAGRGQLLGRVLDANGRTLANANVQLVGTGIGTISDQAGRFVLSNVRPSDYTLRISHLGYATAEQNVQVLADETARILCRLEESSYLVEGVVVVGELSSAQAEALNAQKESANIKSVTSHELFGRFPDANAAETLQRLPGVAIDRDQGEGEYVHVRGLNAQLNSVTVNGQRIPSPTSSLSEGRAVGMDVIQSYSTEYIEVSKALTPDMDADAMGGAINMLLKRPPEQPEYALSVAGGVNDKASRAPKWGSEAFEINASAGRRFLDHRLGLIATGNLHRTNRGALMKRVEYAETGSERPKEIRWDDYDVLRHRLGALIGADYRVSDLHELRLNLTLNRYLDDEVRRLREFSPADSSEKMETRNRREDQHFVMAQLIGTVHRRNLKLTYSGAYAQAGEEVPDRTYFTFERANTYVHQDGAALTDQERAALDLESEFPDLEPFDQFRVRYDNETTTERDWTGGLDGELYFDFRDRQSHLKTGVKVSRKRREATDVRWNYNPPVGTLTATEGEFRFEDVVYTDPEMARIAPLESFAVDDLQPFDYHGREGVYAGYVAANLEWDSQLTALFGVRNEITTQSFSHDDLSPYPSDETYSNFLPSLHLTYRPSERTNLRLALSSSLSRPEYTRLLPAEGCIDGDCYLGNPDLKATRSYGIDLMFETYPPRHGSISGGLFAKRILDPVIDWRFVKRIPGVISLPGLAPINGDAGYLFGTELSIVQHLSILGLASLRYVGLYANHTYVHSETDYGNVRAENGPLLNSARHSANAGLFYDNHLRGLSFTLSLAFRSPMLLSVAEDAADDEWWRSETHVDLAASQRLSPTLRLYVKANNLTDQSRREIYGTPYDARSSQQRFRKRESYGRSATIGVAYQL